MEKKESAIISFLTDFYKFSSHFLLRLRPSLMCITPINNITNIVKVLWKFVHCVIRNPIKVHLSAVGVVLCIEIIGSIRTKRGKCLRAFLGVWKKEVRECVRVAGSGTNFTDPVRCGEIIGINGVS